jgi:hypothetical protein
MYGGVPIASPVWVSPPVGGASARRPEPSSAMPKSTTRAAPSPSIMTFSGLKSRCAMPCACACASPRAAPASTATFASSVRGAAASQSRSESPSTSSITTKRRPPSSPSSCTTTTFGWRSRAIARASVSRRCCRARSPVAACRTLIATGRSRSGSRAAYTVPMPPAPMVRSRTNRPSRSPARSSGPTVARGLEWSVSVRAPGSGMAAHHTARPPSVTAVAASASPGPRAHVQSP